MPTVISPDEEAARLEALNRYHILDTAPEPGFDRITSLAARLFDVPIALISLVDRERLWFKSCSGLAATAAPREAALCEHAILTEDLLIVPDTHADPRFRDTPLVTGAPFIRFYAGAPLVTADGFRLGSLCLIDRQARTFSPAQADNLRDLAATVMEVMEAHRLSRRMALADGERKRTENRLHMLESSVDHANDVVVITEAEPVDGPGPRIIYVNQAFTETTGYTAEEVFGLTPRILQGPGTNPEAKATIRRALKRWKPVRIEMLNYRKDGSEFWVELNIVPVANEKGWYTHWVSVQRDITTRKQVEAVLVQTKHEAQEAQAEAERANRAKSEFLSRMSHELRTPLNAIIGFGQLLEMDRPTERQREKLSHILKGGQHLLGLINEVLDLSKIESGKMEFSLEAVPVAQVVNEAVALIQPLATQRNVRMGRCAGMNCDGVMQADRQRLSQVVLNLLSNAVKYNRMGGTVTIACDLLSEPRRLRLAVSDMGLGIAAADLDKLFTPFERLGAEQRNIEGTGIGLALSKRLVEAMGGTIGVDSVPGRGSTFYLELPALDASVRTPNESVPLSESTELAGGQTVLCIEDNLSNFTLVEQLFEEQRPEIRLLGAMQGTLGLDMAREHHPDLILLDLQLPDLPGDELLQRLQDDAATRGIPVIMVSADATKGQSRRLLDLGARAYLTKPLDVRAFLGTIDEVLAAPASLD